jgi:hypothetical protein
LIANEEFHGPIWEPACGNGAMSEVLKLTGNEIISTDLHDRGYGDGIQDFIYSHRSAPNIVTNPPYNLAEEFVEKGRQVAHKKLCLLLRLSFLESARRYDSIFSKFWPARVWIFSERITFYPNGLQTAGSGTLAYAWFVWDRDEDPATGTQLRWFPPGYKNNLTSIDMAIDL